MKNKIAGLDCLTGEFYKAFKEISVLYKPFQKTEEKGTLLTHEASKT